MDSGFVVKTPRAGVQRTYTARDPVRVRETSDTELAASKTAGATGDGGNKSNDQHAPDHRPPEHHADHAPHDVVVDPATREVLYRERDVRTAEGEHPDQALLRQRAYRQAAPANEPQPAPNEPHANIKA